jgi:transcriptional regulator with GAF, ATPase, and Fis domain
MVAAHTFRSDLYYQLRDTLGETERNQILKALEQSQWVIAGLKGAAA